MKISRRQFYITGFLLLLILDTFSQVCFKIAANHAEPLIANAEWLLRVVMDPWVYGAIVGYIGAFLIWMTMLREVPVGPAFAASHLEVIGVMIVSVPLFGEHLSLLQYFGAALIMVGVGCLAYSEPKETSSNHT
jgi:drug/metabolite transporter (DMT)-like permease